MRGAGGGSAAKLIVEALLQRFLPLARRRIDTAQAQDGQYLRASDPAYEQVLDSLAMVARHTPVHLLEALLKWRESESPKGANDASTFQRKGGSKFNYSKEKTDEVPAGDDCGNES